MFYNDMVVFFENSVTVFIIAQMLTVVISTIKTIKTVNGSAISAAIWNAIAYTMGMVLIKLLTNHGFVLIIMTCLLSNLFGVYVAKWLMGRFEKEKLWHICSTVCDSEVQDVETKFRKHNIQYTVMPAFNDRAVFNVFSYSKGESGLIFEILGKHKYTVSETVK